MIHHAGGRYFERDSDEDSDMHDSDEEFAPAKKKRKGGTKARPPR